MVNPVPATQKNPKNKGPIRYEAIIPLMVVAGMIMIYFMLFFDTHLRRGIEYAATRAVGAEVNIGKLNTSVWEASLVISDIAFTNTEDPARNLIQIGSAKFQMLWDALLRGKIVIDEASINDVQFDTPRNSPGRVLPVKVSTDEEGLSEKILGQLKTEFSGNVVGDLAAVAAGTDPKQQFDLAGADLKSSVYLDQMQKSLDDKNKQWQTRMAIMPKAEEFAILQNRLVKVKLDNLQDVGQIQASLKELESIRNDLDAKSKVVSETGATLKSETENSRAGLSGLDKIVNEDIASLQAKMHLPALDSRTLSRALFGNDVLGKMQQARHYMDEARTYMPTKVERKDEKKAAVAINVREKGRDYVFGQVNSYPPFWLRKALISSRLDKGQSDLTGEILDLSSNQSMVGRPMIATLKGNFPQKGVTGINASLVIDHTSTVPLERLLFEVAHYSVAGRTLVNSPALEFGFSQTKSALKFNAEFEGNKVDVRMNNQFTQMAFETKAQSDVVKEMMAASVAGLKEVNLNAHVSGIGSKLDWQVSSNLADALVRGMQRYLQDKMDGARKRIESQVHGKIKDQRDRFSAQQSELEAVIKSAMGELQAQIDKLRAELNAARSKLDARMNSLVGTQQQKLKQGTDKLLDTFRKK